MKGNWKQDLNRRIQAVLRELEEIALTLTTEAQILTYREWLVVEVERLSVLRGAPQKLDYFTYPGGDRFNNTLFFMERNSND